MKNSIKTYLFLFSLLLFTHITLTAQTEKDTALGKIDGKMITDREFLSNLVSQYGFKSSELNPDKIKSLFKEYYTALAYLKDGEDKGFFSRQEFKERLNRKKTTFIKEFISKVLWEKELLPFLKIEDSDYSPYLKLFKIKHILIATEKRTKTDALEIIQKIQKDLTTANFDKMAQLHSEDPGSSAKGGELGWLDFSHAYFSILQLQNLTLKAGGIIGPTESHYGYHLIFIEKEKNLSLENVKKDLKITEKITKEKQKKLAESYMAELNIKYKDRIHYFPERIQNIEKFKNDLFYSVDGAGSMTVNEAAQLMGSNLEKYQKNMEEVDKAVQTKLINFDLRYLEGVAKGYDKDPLMTQKMDFEINNFMGKVYKSHMEESFVAEFAQMLELDEIKQYYQENLELFKDSQTQVVPSFEKVKDEITGILIRKKTKEKMRAYQSELFSKYQIEIF